MKSLKQIQQKQVTGKQNISSKRVMAFFLSVILCLQPISFVLAEEVVDKMREEYDWNSIAFGQSTDLNFKSTIAEEKVGINQAVETQISISDVEGNKVENIDAVVLESRGGKIANTHDGLTFYYVKIPTSQNFKLTADIFLNQYGPESSTSSAPNTQEGCGLMVRDVIGAPRKDPMEFGYEELPAASNVAFVRVVSKGKSVRSPLSIQSYIRNGVTVPYGNTGVVRETKSFADLPTTIITSGSAISTTSAGIIATTERGVKEDGSYSKEQFFKLGLERTNTGFIMSYTSPTGEQKETIIEKGSDSVAVIDKETMYVGFFASRNAKMTVTNINLVTTEANTREDGFIPASNKVRFDNFSNLYSSTEEYPFLLHANYNGKITIEQDGIPIVTDSEITAGELYEYNTILKQEKTTFDLTYTALDKEVENEVKTLSYTVAKNETYKKKNLYVSVDGTESADGSVEQPLDLQTAVNYISPGYTIYLKGGNYKGFTIKETQSGQKNKLKTISNYNNEVVTFEGASILGGNYWNIKDINVTKSAATGLRITGHSNIIEGCKTYNNGDTGLQLGGSGSDPLLWPKNNLILNCESYDNKDSSRINADGFAAKLGVGEGNIFRGCISHNNADDGWDLFNKLEDGANYPVTLENCIAYENGILLDGTGGSKGSIGNGFKLGGEGLPVDHIVKSCISFNNNMDGFTCNFNPGKITLQNCTSYDNIRANYIFRSNPYRTPAEQGNFINNLSFRSDNNYNIQDFVSGNITNSYFFLNGNNTITASDFVSLEAPASYVYNSEGNIIYGDFLKLRAGTILANKNVGALIQTSSSSSSGSGSDSGQGTMPTPAPSVTEQPTSNKPTTEVPSGTVQVNVDEHKTKVILPTDIILQKLKEENAKQVKVVVIITKEVDTITIEEASLKEAAKAGKDILVTLQDNSGQIKAQWKFGAKQLKQANNLHNLNLYISAIAKGSGLTVQTAKNGVFHVTAHLTIPVTQIKNIKPGQKVYIYRLDNETGKLQEMVRTTSKVSNDLNVTVNLIKGGDYVVLTEKPSSSEIISLKQQIFVKAKQITMKLADKTTKIAVTLPTWISTKESDSKAIGKVDISYKVNNEKLATINQNGKVTAKKKGTVTAIITCKLYNGKVKTEKVKIKIK